MGSERAGEKWENKLDDMRKKAERDIMEIKVAWKKDIEELDGKIVIVRGEVKVIEEITKGMEKEESRNRPTSEIEENKKHIVLLYEEVDEYRMKWESKFMELREDREEGYTNRTKAWERK